jgi:hypothetical protein
MYAFRDILDIKKKRRCRAEASPLSEYRAAGQGYMTQASSGEDGRDPLPRTAAHLPESSVRGLKIGPHPRRCKQNLEYVFTCFPGSRIIKRRRILSGRRQMLAIGGARMARPRSAARRPLLGRPVSEAGCGCDEEIRVQGISIV